MGDDRKIPALCPKSDNPYTYCPLVFVHEDEMIMSYVNAIVVETRRLATGDTSHNMNDAKTIDRYTCEITAYMNGRIHELVRMLKEANKGGEAIKP